MEKGRFNEILTEIVYNFVQMQRQAELDDHPERRPFLERVFSLMEERNQPIKTMPQISTHTLDLFKLYHAVRERGGVLKVGITRIYFKMNSG